ncbi:hypothetical protein [Hyphococcus luteus]|uniref:Uncharacterized protein n=1 Tax=Hyphococcus luteus TaxID=2058213 RepID=A0A2S7JYQ2_9PROT|nr:hypothetical protein [Marinicaulis flavus]PQA85379.1 hypothetical protein CW354_20740 [Marinicaulis flavus]
MEREIREWRLGEVDSSVLDFAPAMRDNKAGVWGGFLMIRFCSLARFGAVLSALVVLLLGAGLQSCGRAHAQEAQLQAGLWYPVSYNIEDYYINLFQLGDNNWGVNSQRLSNEELLAGGYISPEGYPQKMPENDRLYYGGFLQGENWDGKWLILWGPAACAEFKINDGPGDEVSVSPGRLAFTRDYEKNPRLGFRVTITRLDCPLTELAYIRAENEDAYKAGEIWNPRLKPYLADYDMLRMMDPMAGGTATVTHPDQLAKPGSLFWGRAGWPPSGTAKPLQQSMPLEAVIDAGIAYDNALWLNAPLMLGAPQSFWDLRPESGDGQEWNQAFFAMVQDNAETILDSPAWDAYADALIAAMASEGYPQNRPLYIAPGNEVWNWSRQYWLGSHYAHELAKGLPEIGDNLRHGYGVLVARLKMAIDGAQARAGTDFDITVIFEGQTGAGTTKASLEAAKAWLESKGENWDDYAPGFGSSVASYWYADWWGPMLTDAERRTYWQVSKKEREALKGLARERWRESIASDPEGTAERVADFILNGPASGFGLTLAYHLATLRTLVDVSEGQYGVRFVGFYEGGSHFGRPDWMDKDWYETFLWGEQGGRLNYEINVALAKAFPSVMLSNYILAGVVGNHPFSEGPLGADNPYAVSWGKIKEAVRGQ